MQRSLVRVCWSVLYHLCRDDGFRVLLRVYSSVHISNIERWAHNYNKAVLNGGIIISNYRNGVTLR